MAMLMGTTMIALALLLKQKKAIAISLHNRKGGVSSSSSSSTSSSNLGNIQHDPPTAVITAQTKNSFSLKSRDDYAPSGFSVLTAAEAHLKQAMQYTTSLPPFRYSQEFPYDMEREYLQFQKWYQRQRKQKKNIQQRDYASSANKQSVRSQIRSIVKERFAGILPPVPPVVQQMTSLFSKLASVDTTKKKRNRIYTNSKLTWRRSDAFVTSTPSQYSSTSKNDTDALFHLQRAADLGNPHAQYWMGNILASGIYSSIETTSSSQIQITDDVGHGKSQLARAIIQWYFASIQGIQEAQMALGYRYLSAFQATGGGGSAKTNTDGGFGVVGDCATALAYYEEAANTAMDEMESSELRGKIPPAMDRHRLAEMHMHGASSALAHHNKPGR
jgi:TPR repeat protein